MSSGVLRMLPKRGILLPSPCSHHLLGGSCKQSSAIQMLTPGRVTPVFPKPTVPFMKLLDLRGRKISSPTTAPEFRDRDSAAEGSTDWFFDSDYFLGRPLRHYFVAGHDSSCSELLARHVEAEVFPAWRFSEVAAELLERRRASVHSSHLGRCGNYARTRRTGISTCAIRRLKRSGLRLAQRPL